jgi:hypothetical protein
MPTHNFCLRAEAAAVDIDDGSLCSGILAEKALSPRLLLRAEAVA